MRKVPAAGLPRSPVTHGKVLSFIILKVNFYIPFPELNSRPTSAAPRTLPRFLQLDSAAHGFISSCDMQAQPAILSFQIKMD